MAQREGRRNKGKRLVDVCIAAPLLLLASPVIAALLVVSAVSLRRWPLYRQERIGRGGRPFRLSKVRTLSADGSFPELKVDRPIVGANRLLEWMRRTHLDELPQLAQVVRGDMSLVGPRPKMLDEFEPVEPEYGRRRVTVPQGLTGLWQIGSHTHLLPDSHPEYDFAYLELASARLDLWILWHTVRQLLPSGGPIALADLPAWVGSRPTETTEALVALSESESVDVPVPVPVPQR